MMIFELVLAGLFLMLVWWLFKSGLMWWIIVISALIIFYAFYLEHNEKNHLKNMEGYNENITNFFNNSSV